MNFQRHKETFRLGQAWGRPYRHFSYSLNKIGHVRHNINSLHYTRGNAKISLLQKIFQERLLIKIFFSTSKPPNRFPGTTYFMTTTRSKVLVPLLATPCIVCITRSYNYYSYFGFCANFRWTPTLFSLKKKYFFGICLTLNKTLTLVLYSSDRTGNNFWLSKSEAWLRICCIKIESKCL